jgi:LmbE family N-acetylglucosaminyl deacetylase
MNCIRSLRATVLSTLLAALLVQPALAQPQPEPQGAEALALALRRLDTTQRVLMIGAHPDDENTAVLAELALGRGADVAYLSLTRGEGGQNLIGPELLEGLGLIRSEELLSARRIDGGRQFFTRAYDYGFSKSAEEAFTQWPRDSLLADAVAVVRRFRPDIIVSIFSGTPRDGHGQHQAAGIIAREAFSAAADPARFPGQIAAGLAPHRTASLVQSLWRGTEAGAITLETGTYDPVLGRSWHQSAMASRSRHRSQDMGVPQPAGPQQVALIPLAGDLQPGAATLFAGADTTLSQRADRAGLGAALAVHLRTYTAAVSEAVDTFNPLRSASLTGPLSRALQALEALHESLPGDNGDEEFRFHLTAERADVERALQLAAGLVLDATASAAAIVPGDAVELTVSLWNGGRSTVRALEVAPRVGAGWRIESLDGDAPADIVPGSLLTRRFRVHVPADASPTRPYFLEQPLEGAMYAWPADTDVRGLPFEPATFGATARVRLGDVAVPLATDATRVEIDKSMGELRLPVAIVPAVALAISPDVLVSPLQADDPAREVTVELRAQRPGIEGTLSLDLPEGWTASPRQVDVTFPNGTDRRGVSFMVRPPERAGASVLRINARFASHDGRVYDEGFTIIAYPHTQPRPLYRPATARVARIDVDIADDLRVGYIEGAGDDGAAALRQMGARLDMLDAQALATADFSVYDVIIAGIRAYEVRFDLIANNARLLDYVREGGTFIVQYNKYELVEDGYTALPFTMARPHGRVTDESASVRILEPEHPLLSWPNRIDERDFDGWAHERGLYFADTWDDGWVPLLEMADPGESPLQGSLIAARVGEGWYVYSGLALFRQWPEAVPGAFRLFANMASLGRAPTR